MNRQQRRMQVRICFRVGHRAKTITVNGHDYVVCTRCRQRLKRKELTQLN